MSYSTIAEANLLNLQNTEWNALDDITKQALLDKATEKINSLCYDLCEITGEDNIFPMVSQDVVPNDVKDCCSYEAGQLAKGTKDGLMIQVSMGISSESELAASVSYDLDKIPQSLYSNKTFWSSEAWELIFPWTCKSASWGG